MKLPIHAAPLLPLLLAAGAATAQPSPEQFAELAEVIEAERVALGAPGVAFAYFEDGEILFAQGFGSAHPSEDIPIDGDTLFRMGSVNKMLTAIGALQQVEAGRLDLNAPITDVIPDFVLRDDPAITSDMTLELLLSHRAALVDFLTLNGNPQDRALERFMTGTFARTQFAMAPPGLFWNYANPNFYVAGLMIEAASGDYYRPYMEREVFDPIGMSRTVFLGEEVIERGNYATGLSLSIADEEGNPYVSPLAYDNGWARPAGFAWTSVRDLARLADFLMEGDGAILSDDLRRQMMDAHTSLDVYGDEVGYGHGLFHWEGMRMPGGVEHPVTLIEHGGDIPGFAADLAFIPELGRGVAVLASTDGAHFGSSIRFALTMGELPAAVPSATFPPRPETYPSLVGWYEDPHGTVGPMHIQGDERGLTVRFPLLDRADIPYDRVLIPVTTDNFVVNIQGYGLLTTFYFDDTGAPEWVRNRLFVSTPAEGKAPRIGEALDADGRRALLENLRQAAALDAHILGQGAPTLLIHKDLP